MKTSLLRLLISAVITGAFLGAAGLQAQEFSASARPARKLLVPLSPAGLLALLPAAPSGWQIKQSQASNFYMDWLCSEAHREFSFTPAAAVTAGPDQAAAVQTLMIKLIDTGYFPDLMGDFLNFTPGKTNERESLMLGGFPAILVPLGRAGQRLRVLVKGRFVVQIDALNQAANAAQRWLQTIDVIKLAALSNEGGEKLPQPLTIARIDELNPGGNSTTQMAWSAEEETDATAKGR